MNNISHTSEGAAVSAGLLYFEQRCITHRDSRSDNAASQPHSFSTSALKSALDTTGIGLAILDLKGLAIAVNEAFGNILSETPRGLVWSNNVLWAKRQADRRGLADALRTAGHGETSALNVQDLDSPGRVELIVKQNPAIGNGPPRALVIMRDPAALSPDTKLLTQLYRFTHAEARLASVLVSGAGLAEACRERGITVNTGKGYLKRIFQKTGARRQSELVAIILGGVSAFQQSAGARDLMRLTG